MKNPVYLDNASTTFPKPECVYTAMDKLYRSRGYNAGRSGHPALSGLSDLILAARSMTAMLLGGPSPDRVVFTPSATIALNILLQGFPFENGDCVFISPLEHNAVLRPLYQLRKKLGLEICQIPMKDSFTFDMTKLQTMMALKQPRLICCTHVSNVNGLICPVEELARTARKYGVPVLVDGTQGAGLSDINVVKAGIDFYVFAGHKTLYGPFGIAGFIYNSEIRIESLYHGGTGSHSDMEFCPDVIPTRYEAGSQNIMAVAGLHESLKWLLKRTPANILAHERRLMIHLKEFIRKLPDLKIVEIPDELSAGIVSCIPEKCSSADYARFLADKFDIVTRAGAHCAPHAHELMGTLKTGTVRFSLGYFNTVKQIRELMKKC